jgi:hypothetical protein
VIIKIVPNPEFPNPGDRASPYQIKVDGVTVGVGTLRFCELLVDELMEDKPKAISLRDFVIIGEIME